MAWKARRCRTVAKGGVGAQQRAVEVADIARVPNAGTLVAVGRKLAKRESIRLVKTISTVLFLTCFLSLGVADASAHRLGKGEARSTAESKAFDFQVARSWLDSSDTKRCRRRTQLRVDCEALVTGETEVKASSCRLRIAVEAVPRRYFWDSVAKIISSHCDFQPTPHLTYGDAKQAIQAEADRFAGQATSVTSLYRQDLQTYKGTAEWKRVNPTGCKGCGYDPASGKPFDKPETESCSVELKATRLSEGDGIRVDIESSACY